MRAQGANLKQTINFRQTSYARNTDWLLIRLTYDIHVNLWKHALNNLIICEFLKRRSVHSWIISEWTNAWTYTADYTAYMKKWNFSRSHQHRKGRVYTTLPVIGAEFTASQDHPFRVDQSLVVYFAPTVLDCVQINPNESHTATWMVRSLAKPNKAAANSNYNSFSHFQVQLFQKQQIFFLTWGGPQVPRIFCGNPSVWEENSS